jgi:inosose dehydratase
MLAGRIAGAPISWGVCEVPGWGHQLGAERVLGEMSKLGLAATEFGPEGFLPSESTAKAEVLRGHGLQAVGGFLPLVLHDARLDPMKVVDAFIDDCVACGAGVMVLAATSGLEGYNERPVLDDAAWTVMLAHLDRISARAAARRVLATIHPHVGTMIENADDVSRVLRGSEVALCVDTGHLLVAGADPVSLTKDYPDRVGHVHLKDVDVDLAQQVGDGTMLFTDAVRAGLFRPLGRGDVDIATLVATLESEGYTGWYVLEQDVMLRSEPVDEGPLANVRESIAFLEQVAG